MSFREKLLEAKEKNKKSNPLARLMLFIVLFVGLYYGQQAWVNHSVNNQFEDQYNLAKQGGDKTQICVQAQLVVQGYLQSNDQENYKKWKAIEADDCGAAGYTTAVATTNNALAQMSGPANTPASQAATPAASQSQVAPQNSGPISPSFDCAKAGSAQERLVCGDNELAALDVKLHDAYLVAHANPAIKDQVLQQQRTWLKNSFRVCNDKPCLVSAYNSRLAELGAVN